MNPVVAQILITILGELGEVLVAIFRDLYEKDVVGRAVELAKLHVLNMVKADVSNEEKARLAKLGLREDLEREGIGAKDQLVNMALELAVASLKAAGQLISTSPTAAPAQ